MKCLSLIQPWATLVIRGVKRYEARNWKTHYRGRLAIHACRMIPYSAQERCAREPVRSFLLSAGFRLPGDLPRGKILGTVELVDCIPMRSLRRKSRLEREIGDFRPGWYAWVFENPRPAKNPFVCSGNRGLFEVGDW
jgi:hypothetical protein